MSAVDILRGEDLERVWRQCLDAWTSATASEREACWNSVASLRDQFLAVLADVTDPEEQKTLVALFYAQVRCQWILLNTRSGYQLAAGVIDGSNHCRSGMLSAFLGQLEACMSPANVASLSRFLAQPTRTDLLPESEEPSPETASDIEEDGLRRVLADEEVNELRSLVRALMSERDSLERELAATRAGWLLLEEHLGPGDARVLARRVQELQNRVAAMDDLQSMLEQTVALVNV
jgi:hypothetical protein